MYLPAIHSVITACFCRGKWFLLAVIVMASGMLHAEIRIHDDAGQLLVLDQPARRIVSLAPHVTELLFAAGAGEFVVGVSQYSDFPEAARDIPRVGGGSGLDIEAIVALQPDLVIGWQSGNPVMQLERLRSLGLALFVSEPRTISDIPDTLHRFSQFAGTESVAQAQIEAFNRRHAALQQAHAGDRAVSVFYQIWDRPLMTVNGNHLISAVIRLCGGRNVFGDLPELAPQIDVEAVLSHDPEVLVVAGESTGKEDLLATWRRWPQLRAVREQHLYVLERDLLVRHTPRILEGAERLCAILDKVRKGSLQSQ